jgi:tRNA-dihydrouridine synthase 3
MPAKINWRSPGFVGRDDMETLMASSQCSDWIKISEMLLGPVPDGFYFTPKHKASSSDDSAEAEG